MHVLNWIKSWFVAASVARQLSGSQNLLIALAARAQQSSERLDERSKELSALVTRIETDITDAKRIHLRYESALDEVREQNRVLETTIQTLVASHKLLMERYDCETALQVRTKIAASQVGRE